MNKIIVDKIPEIPSECFIAAPLNLIHPNDVYVCNFDGQICKVDEYHCPYLKSINEYVTEKPELCFIDGTGAIVNR